MVVNGKLIAKLILKAILLQLAMKDLLRKEDQKEVALINANMIQFKLVRLLKIFTF